MQNIAIVAIAYNRISSLKRLLKSLEASYYDGESGITLIISIDKSNTDEVEKFADDYQWQFGDKRVVKHEQNLGLKKHVLSQGSWLDEFDAIVVLEDDVVVAPDFWFYVQACVSKYHDSEDIAGISLYGFSIEYHLRHPFIPLHDGHDVYFMNCAMSWGQVWMRKSWREFEEWYEQNQKFTPSNELPVSICSWGDKSWLKFHTRYCIEKNKYFVFPYISYSTNFSDCGVHISVDDTIYQVPLLYGKKRMLNLPDRVEDGIAYDGFFENKKIYQVFGLKPSECCIDLLGTNSNRAHKRYWLTTRNLPYKVVRHFSMELRPLEMNVLQKMEEGNGIFLYDTHVKDSSVKVIGNPVFLSRHFIQNSFIFLREFGYKNVVRDFLKVVKTKLK